MTAVELPSLVETPSLKITGMPAFCQALAAVIDGEEWTGTKNELLQELCAAATKRGLDTDSDPFWPTDAAGLWGTCTTYADLLELLGLFRKKGGSGRRVGSCTPRKQAKNVEHTDGGNGSITFFRDAERGQMRADGMGSVYVRRTSWMGVWRAGDQHIVRKLGDIADMSRSEAENLAAHGPPERQNRPAGAGTLLVAHGSWTAQWMHNGQRHRRAIGKADAMTLDEAEAALEGLIVQGSPTWSLNRPKGSGTLRVRRGKTWQGQWRVNGQTRSRTLGDIDAVTREEAEAKLQQLIAETAVDSTP